jgi:hypothetical protein
MGLLYFMGLASENARLDSYRRQEIFNHFTTFIGVLGLTSGLAEWVHPTLSRRGETVWHGADHSPSSVPI